MKELKLTEGDIISYNNQLYQLTWDNGWKVTWCGYNQMFNDEENRLAIVGNIKEVEEDDER